MTAALLPPDEWTSAEYLAYMKGQSAERGNKYHAILTRTDDRLFHSKGEARRYLDLKLRLAAGEISDLRLQVRYDLMVAGVLITTYIADFVYLENGQEVVEDFKGKRTEVYRIKARLMLAVLGITIYETGSEDNRRRRSKRKRSRRGMKQ
jgi:hypothetical protein